MLKVFLVEDEFVVREGIKRNVDWQTNGYEFCGEAGDGELAFPMIQKLQPDIVITDIRMPFMDGLELSRLIKKEFPWMEIIILTGFEEFEYAKEAISLGVAKYLLKPISGDELLKELADIGEKIEEKKKEREIREQYAMEMEENFQQEKKDLFQYLVTGSKSMPELFEIAERMKLDISALWYNIVLVKVQSANHAPEEYSKRMISIEKKLKYLVDEPHIISFDRNLEGKALIFKADSVEELESLQNAYITGLEKELTGDDRYRYFGGIGKPVNRLRELPTSFESASHAFAQRYLIKENCILDSSNLEQNFSAGKEEFDIHNIDPKELQSDRIREFLKLGSTDEVVYFVDEFFKRQETSALNSTIFRQYIVMDVYFCVAAFLEEQQISREEISSFDVKTEMLQSKENAIEYVTKIIETAVELREKNASNRYGTIVDQVKKYIEEHYVEEELSLNLVASYVNFSPNHLSMVFSQQTGQTFIKYLTDYRMNKAKELLRGTGKRSSEISLEVGYKDPHYFSYLFKKTQGMTPTQYRGKKGGEGDE
ncbi:MAG: response regulator [Lachnospiraceae bacterium]|nr:response regulator [Lachnospiraceae bacterium]MBO5176800.1 response regulator [Lachnospiraceae bacterium]MBP3568736.1 response regulator [Lachnospiraceae bacterium]